MDNRDKSLALEMSGLWGSGALARTLAALRRRVGESGGGRSADEEAGRGEAPDSPLSPDHPMGQHGEAGSRAEDGALKRPRAPVRRSAPDLRWEDDELDDVDDEDADAGVLQMAAAQRRAASAAAQRRGAPSMQAFCLLSMPCWPE
ncbi:hypothetical protein M885DRAFT_627213 [Pelagophyceae sp. CCMP2097]|nr:hypothetical protein M885DRAFT_627213 [Pelagophyceae sp. CCMP2097]